jgi:hypothetical protein
MAVRWEGAAGDLRPVLVCDACGEALDGAGIAAFDVDESGARTGRFRILHTAGCELADPDTRALPRMDLGEFFAVLSRNARLSGDPGES